MYTEEVPALLDTDPASASNTFNPLFTKVLNNIKATHTLADNAYKTASSASDAASKSIQISQMGKINGVATLDKNGKVPKDQLPTTGGYVRQAKAPDDTSLLWMDSANGDIMKYYNGTSWVPQVSVWG